MVFMFLLEFELLNNMWVRLMWVGIFQYIWWHTSTSHLIFFYIMCTNHTQIMPCAQTPPTMQQYLEVLTSYEKNVWWVNHVVHRKWANWQEGFRARWCGGASKNLPPQVPSLRMHNSKTMNNDQSKNTFQYSSWSHEKALFWTTDPLLSLSCAVQSLQQNKHLLL